MKRITYFLSAAVLIIVASAFVVSKTSFKNEKKAKYKWTGVWQFTRTSSGDGITNLDIKIGKNVILPNVKEYANAIFNVNNQFPGSKPWSTLAVGNLERLIPTAQNMSDQQQVAYLNEMKRLGVAVFVEIFPFKDEDVNVLIDEWLAKFKHYPNVIGLGVELEYYGKATDALAKAWDTAIKKHNPKYRLFLRHYDPEYMPPTYRGKGDLIFVDHASEGDIKDLNQGFASWANRFAPTACAFHIGYPADEDDMQGNNSSGWWKLSNPIKEWGDGILPLIKDTNQELGLIWITTKSGKTYNTSWDLTKGATLPKGK